MASYSRRDSLDLASAHALAEGVIAINGADEGDASHCIVVRTRVGQQL